MKKLLVLGLAATFVSTLSMAVLAENEPVNVVKGTAVLDGKTDEFTKAGAQVIKLAGQDMLKDAADLRDDKDLSGTACLMYDDKYLYFGANVTDDNLTMDQQSESNVWNQDCVELWIEGYQFGLSMDASSSAPIAWDWKGSGVTGEVFVKPLDAGYVLEARFPLSDLKGAEVATGKGASFQVAVGIDDADNGGTRHAQLYFPTSWVHSSPESFATATFK